MSGAAPVICDHGQLARQCLACDLIAERDTAIRERDTLQRKLDAIGRDLLKLMHEHGVKS